MKTFTLVRGIVAVLLLVLPAVATVITPIDGGLVGGTLTVINNSSGDQADPHVSGDLACYTSNLFVATIHYYRFSTGIDAAILGSSLSDILCDVSGNRITFTRFGSDRTAIFIFDATT